MRQGSEAPDSSFTCAPTEEKAQAPVLGSAETGPATRTRGTASPHSSLSRPSCSGPPSRTICPQMKIGCSSLLSPSGLTLSATDGTEGSGCSSKATTGTIGPTPEEEPKREKRCWRLPVSRDGRSSKHQDQTSCQQAALSRTQVQNAHFPCRESTLAVRKELTKQPWCLSAKPCCGEKQEAAL